MAERMTRELVVFLARKEIDNFSWPGGDSLVGSLDAGYEWSVGITTTAIPGPLQIRRGLGVPPVGAYGELLWDLENSVLYIGGRTSSGDPTPFNHIQGNVYTATNHADANIAQWSGGTKELIADAATVTTSQNIQCGPVSGDNDVTIRGGVITAQNWFVTGYGDQAAASGGHSLNGQFKLGSGGINNSGILLDRSATHITFSNLTSELRAYDYATDTALSSGADGEVLLSNGAGVRWGPVTAGAAISIEDLTDSGTDPTPLDFSNTDVTFSSLVTDDGIQANEALGAADKTTDPIGLSVKDSGGALSYFGLREGSDSSIVKPDYGGWHFDEDVYIGRSVSGPVSPLRMLQIGYPDGVSGSIGLGATNIYMSSNGVVFDQSVSISNPLGGVGLNVGGDVDVDGNVNADTFNGAATPGTPISFKDDVRADTVNEDTTDAGVTIESVLIKDGCIPSVVSLINAMVSKSGGASIDCGTVTNSTVDIYFGTIDTPITCVDFGGIL